MNTEFNPVPMPDDSRDRRNNPLSRNWRLGGEAQSGIRSLPCRDDGSRSRTIAAGFLFSAWRNVKTQAGVIARPSGLGGVATTVAGSNPAALILYPLVVAAMLAAAPKLSGASADNTLTTPQVAEIVAAIYRLEGGDKTKYPYGIRSINTHGDKAMAKRICENTVRNNYKRWIKAGSKGDYLDFLADRYCPPSADKQGNINWRRNIHKLVKWTL